MVTTVPTWPNDGNRLVMRGPTEYTTPLLARPPTVTTTGPVDAPSGTSTVTAVAVQVVGTATMPLIVTVLVPCVAPKLVPTIVTGVPIKPDGGERLNMPGVTVNGRPLLA